jgi:ATP-dependent Lon protease
MKVISAGVQGARYPYGVNSYESLSTHLNNLASAKHVTPDTVATQLRHSKVHEGKIERQKERLYKRKERSLFLTDQWEKVDKQLQHKNEYEKTLDQLKNTTLKGLTHEQMNAVEKQLEALFGRKGR